MLSPLEQFRIYNYFNLSNDFIDISINSLNLYILFGILMINFFIRKFPLYILELHLNNAFLSILSILNTAFYPFVISIFYVILSYNLFGLIPYSFSVTSQIYLVFGWSFTILLGVTLLSIYIHKINFIQLFLPNNVPKVLLFFIFFIEILSYLSRVLSLSVRLAINMIAGHVLLYIFGSFASYLLPVGIIILPVVFAFYILEFGVCFIQAYVFALLTASYIKDGVLLH